MKRLFIALATVSLILTGCSKNETEDYNIPNPDVITFSSSTSRAVIADLSTLTNATNGFRVYGKTNDVNNAWYTNVDGSNNYKYSTSWGWAGTPATWPTSAASYPMNFYAMYPDVAPAETPATVLTREITIAGSASTQEDLLAAKATANAKPASGQLSMVFNHILSKVNFGVIAGNGMTPEVQSVEVRNVHSKNTYDYISQAWDVTTTDIASYDYFRNTALPFTTTGSDEDTPVPFYTDNTTPTAASAHLMLMPQSSATSAPEPWDKTQSDLDTDAYIKVIYRITDASGNYIGYDKGSDYLTDYTNYPNDITWEPYTGGLGTNGTTEYNGHLYICVGFPLTINWTPGKGYTYNICLGTASSTNGYYVDDTYYDENGVDTGIPINGPDDKPVKPGDPVTGGTINFLISVANWDDTTPTPLQ